MNLLHLSGLARFSAKQHGVFVSLCLLAAVLPEVFMLSGVASTPLWSIAFIWYPVVLPALLYLAVVWICGKDNLWRGIAAASWLLVLWFVVPLLAAVADALTPWALLPQAPRMFAGAKGELIFLVVLAIAVPAAWRLADSRPIRPGAVSLAGGVSVGSALIALAILYSISYVPVNFDRNSVPDKQHIFKHIEDIYHIGARRPGSEPHKRATRYIFDSLQALGIDDVRSEGFMIDTWNAGHWQMQVDNGSGAPLAIESFYTPWSKPTGSDGVTGPLVYVGAGSESDLAGLDLTGKILLVDYFSTDMLEAQLRSISYMGYDMGPAEDFNSHKVPFVWAYEGYLKFVERLEGSGAAGIVGVLNGYPDFGEFTYYAPYNGEYAPFTSIYIPQSEGDRLKALMRKGELTANLVLQADAVEDTVDLVYAVLPGTSESSVVIHSHMDSPWASAVEDASGVAMVLGLAAYYAQLPEQQRSKTLIFLFTADHFAGGKATGDFIAKHRHGLLSELVLNICIEHIALEYNPPAPVSDRVEPSLFFTSENPVIVAQLSQLIDRYALTRSFLLPTATPVGMPNDGHFFWLEGYNVVANISGPSWLFDKVDTLDKVAADRLVPSTKLYIDFIRQLSRYPDMLLSLAPNHILLAWYLCVINPALLLFGIVLSSPRQELRFQ